VPDPASATQTATEREVDRGAHLPSGDGSGIELVLESKKHGIKANAIEKDGEVTILSGSTAIAKAEFSSNNYEGLRNYLISEGLLVPAQGGDWLGSGLIKATI
jgi:hypothetical protein